MFRISSVREFPPKLERRIFVSGEFRKGMCLAFLPLVSRGATFARQENDLRQEKEAFVDRLGLVEPQVLLDRLVPVEVRVEGLAARLGLRALVAFVDVVVVEQPLAPRQVHKVEDAFFDERGFVGRVLVSPP